MKLSVALASLLLASTAYAQAPGDYGGGGEGELAPPSMAPVVAPVVAPPPPPQRRWSVGLGLGSMELAPHSAPTAKTNFDLAQLAVRYRPWRRLEIELALGGGHETDDEGYAYREVSSAVLALRYRFNPQRRWNWWLMAGMGSLAVTREGASDAEREAAHQSTLQFGAGLERRWSRFALQAELRIVGVAPRDEMTVEAEPSVPIETMTPPGYYDEGAPAGDGWKGGQFVFSGNYYF